MPIQTYIGCAGWGIPKEHLADGGGHRLQQYSKIINCVEINSSFYREHKASTYAKWAELVPDHFRFSVKVPKSIMHGTKYAEPILIDPLLEGIKMLAHKCGPLLLQTPPRLEFDRVLVENFLGYVRKLYEGKIVCEPRHVSWTDEQAKALLETFKVSYVAADPGLMNIFESIGTSLKTSYIRLHGAPRIYYTSYSDKSLKVISDSLKSTRSKHSPWVIFDNTASGAAFNNALRLIELCK